jgi:hypothetical protein
MYVPVAIDADGRNYTRKGPRLITDRHARAPQIYRPLPPIH